MRRRREMSWATLAMLILVTGSSAAAQTGPVNGIRPAEVRTHAIEGAAVVVAPGQRLDRATVVIRDGVIAAVGTGVEPPPGARVWSGPHGDSGGNAWPDSSFVGSLSPW